jgi:EAL domain-containing protein (putative c-di-GMP-specific phosphodiesterase class I)
MARPGFVDSVRGHLRRLDVAPDGFVFELTEQGMVGDRERATSAIADLQDLGVLVAMDDFGAGNASLISLSNLDLDIVKLDRALVAGLDTTRGFRILRTAIDLLRDLGVVIIAEGIEQPAVTSMLTRLGVNYGQGFGLGRPEPLDALLRRLALSPVVDLRDSVVKPLFSANR